jgi:hypothetical protein
MLSGEIPLELYDLASLTEFFVNGNADIEGEIPDEISKLDSLRQLRLGGTRFGGEIPDAIFTMTNLIELEIPNANFVGSLVANQWLNLTGLVDIDLSFNDFEGAIPDIFHLFLDLGESSVPLECAQSLPANSHSSIPSLRYNRGAQTAGE